MKTVRQKREPRPVQEIEVSKKNIKTKVVLLIVALVVALASFTVGIISCVSEPKGWKTVKTSGSLDCSGDFVFYYYLDVGGVSGNTKYKGVTALYSQACYDAYRIFNERDTFDGYNNIAYINNHPNRELTVDEHLYKAFELLESFQSRNIYLAPIYEYYNSMLYADNDSDATIYYPVAGSQTEELFNKIVAFAANTEAVNLQLLGDNKVKLNVSDDYLAYANENEITVYINLFTLKNAFITDYLIEKLSEGGCTKGSVSSRDGYMRCLENTDVPSSLGIYDKVDTSIRRAANINFTGSASIVRYRDYTFTGADYGLNYTFKDGKVITGYVDVATGLNKSSIHNLVAFSSQHGCAYLTLSTFPVYVADSFDTAKIEQLKEGGVYTVYCENDVVKYNTSQLELTNLLEAENIKYTAQLVP